MGVEMKMNAFVTDVDAEGDAEVQVRRVKSGSSPQGVAGTGPHSAGRALRGGRGAEAGSRGPRHRHRDLTLPGQP